VFAGDRSKKLSMFTYVSRFVFLSSAFDRFPDNSFYRNAVDNTNAEFERVFLYSCPIRHFKLSRAVRLVYIHVRTVNGEISADVSSSNKRVSKRRSRYGIQPPTNPSDTNKSSGNEVLEFRGRAPRFPSYVPWHFRRNVRRPSSRRLQKTHSTR